MRLLIRDLLDCQICEIYMSLLYLYRILPLLYLCCWLLIIESSFAMKLTFKLY